MKKVSYTIFFITLLTILISACSNEPVVDNTSGDTDAGVELLEQAKAQGNYPTAKNGDILLGNKDYLAISYGAWRSDVRDSGELVPTVAEQKEDMKILSAMGIKVLRTYNTQNYIGLDGKSNTQNLLEAIKQLKEEDPDFEMYVMLGIWIDALNSFTDKPVVHDKENETNVLEMAMGIKLAQEYPSIVKVLAVGNEAMVHWAPYHVDPVIILKHVNALQALKAQGLIDKSIWITSSDNHASWGSLGLGEDNPYDNDDLKALIAAVDYISLHTYPFHDTYYDKDFWLVPSDEANLSVKQKVDLAMIRAKDLVIEQTAGAQAYMLSLGIDKQIHIGETGWASKANVQYGESGSKAADEYKQKAFSDAMRKWSNDFGASLFLFQAFDEPWKGDANNPGDSEKHFGLIDIDGNAKYVAWDSVDKLNKAGLSRGEVSTFTKSFNGDINALMATVSAPQLAPATAESDNE
jgi:exo-beta-1,3-glucanase (GH17 family)